jgi:uncharacterized protein (TIGR00266 family)
MQPGETPLRVEAGAMVGRSPSIDMETKAGGMMKGMKAMLGGESFFMNKFTASGGKGEVLVGSALPGDLQTIEVSGAQGWSIARGAFVACEDTVEIETKFGGLKAVFSGTGLAHLKATGSGKVIIGAFGAFETLPVNGSLIVDNGHIVAWSSSLDYKVTKAGGGFIAAFLSGEGAVCRFSGQGEVLIQTRNATEFGQLVGGMMPPV